MISAIATRVAEAWALAAGLQGVLWLVQQRTRNAGTGIAIKHELMPRPVRPK